MELSSPVLASSSVPPTAVGKPDTILINIIIEIPFPIPSQKFAHLATLKTLCL